MPVPAPRSGLRSFPATTRRTLLLGTPLAVLAGVSACSSDPNRTASDSDGSGTSATCVSSTIGSERLQDATAWLASVGLKGFLGEIGAGSNAACISAIQGALCSMQQSGVWLGALWWAAGPWWGDVSSLRSPFGACCAC